MIILGLTVLLMIGIGESAIINLVIVIIKIIVILLFIFACCGYTHRSNYSPFIPPNEGTYKTLKLIIQSVINDNNLLFLQVVLVNMA